MTDHSQSVDYSVRIGGRGRGHEDKEEAKEGRDAGGGKRGPFAPSLVGRRY